MFRPAMRVLRIRMTKIPKSAHWDQPADELAVDQLGPPARRTAMAANEPARHRLLPRTPTETMRRPRVPRLHRRRLRPILAPLRTEPLVLSSSLIGSPTADTNPATERHRRRVAVTRRRRTLRTAAGAVPLIAVNRPEQLPTSATGLHRRESGRAFLDQTTSGREISLRGSRLVVQPKNGMDIAARENRARGREQFSRTVKRELARDAACRWDAAEYPRLRSAAGTSRAELA